jgi:ABC-type transporter Mla subunit MlaD
MTNKQFLTQFNRVKRKLALDRDELRALLADAGDVLATSERASDLLDEAADELSELL